VVGGTRHSYSSRERDRRGRGSVGIGWAARRSGSSRGCHGVSAATSAAEL